ncbi:MAG: ATP-binding protein [Elusimicrobia bacterium]|nr:ATP-binding protein [Elusimicrobiota bacterium]
MYYNLIMIKRAIESKCIELAKQYPVITITGPRQSGKTTLARKLFPDKPYINFEDPDNRSRAKDDPRGLLKDLPDGAIFDEIQRVPEIPSYLQGIVDEKKKKGMFILTGSQQFEVSQTISQSLAGRTALLKLLPLSYHEISEAGKSGGAGLEEFLLKGFYPQLYKEKIDTLSYYMNYYETYIERDLRQLSQVENLHTFDKFIRMLASRIGQIVNYNSIANDVGVSQPTIRKWLSLLEASYIAFVLPPYFANIGKRLIKTPKIYFYDTGLVSYLLGIENPRALRHHYLRGALFENFVVSEFLKSRFNKGMSSNLLFFRDRTGNEADLVVENALSVDLVEIKSAETYNESLSKGINKVKDMIRKKTRKAYVVYAGEKELSIKGIDYLPWRKIPTEL